MHFELIGCRDTFAGVEEHVWELKRKYPSINSWLSAWLTSWRRSPFWTHQKEHSLLQSLLGEFVQTALSDELLQTESQTEDIFVFLFVSVGVSAPPAICSASVHSPGPEPLGSRSQSGLFAAPSASGSSPAGWDCSGAGWLSPLLPSLLLQGRRENIKTCHALRHRGVTITFHRQSFRRCFQTQYSWN